MNRDRLWLAFLIGALLAHLFAASDLHAQQAVGMSIEHTIVVPDTLARVSPLLPLSSEYLPGDDYDRWWHEIADCEGLRLPSDYGRVRFFQVNAVHFYDRDHPSLFWRDGVLMVRWAIGQSFPWEAVIFVALPYRLDRLVVEHEMLHMLISWNGIPPGEDLHPLPYYARCGMEVQYHAPKG